MRVGVDAKVQGIRIRGIKHLSECLVAMYPDEFPDDRCTCWDDSPEWTIS